MDVLEREATSRQLKPDRVERLAVGSGFIAENTPELGQAQEAYLVVTAKSGQIFDRDLDLTSDRERFPR